MSNKWQIVVLGLAIVQGAGLGAMENNSPNSPRRNPLGCSAEVRKEAAVAEVIRKNSGDLSKEARVALSYGCYAFCNGGPIEYYPSHLQNNSQRDTYPYYPHGR